MTRLDDIIIDGGGDLDKPKLRGVFKKHAEYESDGPGNIERIRSNPGREPWKVCFKSFCQWVGRELEYGYYDMKDDYEPQITVDIKQEFKKMWNEREWFRQLYDDKLVWVSKGGGIEGEGLDYVDDDDADEGSGSEYGKIREVGLVEGGQVNVGKMKGLMLKWSRDVGEIEVENDFGLRYCHSSFYEWCVDMFGSEWFKFMDDFGAHQQIMDVMFNSHDEFRTNIKSKIEVVDRVTNDDLVSDSGSKITEGDNSISKFVEEYGGGGDIGNRDDLSSHVEFDDSDREPDVEDEGGVDEDEINEWAQRVGSTTEDIHPDFDRYEDEIVQGDSKEIMRNMPPNCVDLIVTSPPYWQMRQYEIDKDADWQDGEWQGQLGHEPEPDMFVEDLMEVFDMAKRVLKKKGNLWVNLDDKYGPPQDYPNALPNKCKALVPERFKISMYDHDWMPRQDIIWGKRVMLEDKTVIGGCSPSSVHDRFNNNASEPFMHFVQQQDYYFNLDVERREHQTESSGGMHFTESAKNQQRDDMSDFQGQREDDSFYHDEGANLPDVWQVNTVNTGDEHFAAYPEKLIRRIINVCCPEGGVVLDPFAGTGTTCKTAADMGRHYIGLDMSEKYVEIARRNMPDGLQVTFGD